MTGDGKPPINMVMTWGWFRAWHWAHTAVDFPQKSHPHPAWESCCRMCSLHGLKQHDLVLLKDAHLAGGLEPWNFMTFHLLGIIIPNIIIYLIFFRGVGIPPTSHLLNASFLLADVLQIVVGEASASIPGQSWR